MRPLAVSFIWSGSLSLTTTHPTCCPYLSLPIRVLYSRSAQSKSTRDPLRHAALLRSQKDQTIRPSYRGISINDRLQMTESN